METLNQWHRFECEYLATRTWSDGSKTAFRVKDWIDTGATSISTESVGHFWKVRGYVITEQQWHEVEITPGELKAVITRLEE